MVVYIYNLRVWEWDIEESEVQSQPPQHNKFEVNLFKDPILKTSKNTLALMKEGTIENVAGPYTVDGGPKETTGITKKDF